MTEIVLTSRFITCLFVDFIYLGIKTTHLYLRAISIKPMKKGRVIFKLTFNNLNFLFTNIWCSQLSVKMGREGARVSRRKCCKYLKVVFRDLLKLIKAPISGRGCRVLLLNDRNPLGVAATACTFGLQDKLQRAQDLQTFPDKSRLKRRSSNLELRIVIGEIDE